MALPYFTDKDTDTFTFPKGRFLPVSEPVKPNQIVGQAGGGQVKVADLGDAEEFYPITLLRVTAAKRNELLSWFADASVNYRQHAFDFTDEDATTISVRLWSKVLDFPLAKGTKYNIKFTLRKEI